MNFSEQSVSPGYNEVTKFWVIFALSLVFTPLAIWICVSPWNVDPETSQVLQFAPAQVTALFFPYANPFLPLRTMSAPWRQIPLFSTIVSCALQFPIYGVILGQASVKHCLRPTVLKLLLVHGIAVLIALLVAILFPHSLMAHL